MLELMPNYFEIIQDYAENEGNHTNESLITSKIEVDDCFLDVIELASCLQNELNERK